MKLNELATIKIGISNSMRKSQESHKICDLKTLRDGELKVVQAYFSPEQIIKYRINERMILMSQMETSINRIVDGKKYRGALIGKNIYAIEFVDLEDKQWVYHLLKNNSLFIPTQGSAIKQVVKGDLEMLEIPRLDRKVLRALNQIDNTVAKMLETSEQLKMYQRGILQKAMKSDKRENIIDHELSDDMRQIRQTSRDVARNIRLSQRELDRKRRLEGLDDEYNKRKEMRAKKRATDRLASKEARLKEQSTLRNQRLREKLAAKKEVK